MKVKDLIEKLQAIDPELMVVRDGYEGGVTEVVYVVVEEVALNVNEVGTTANTKLCMLTRKPTGNMLAKNVRLLFTLLEEKTK